MTVDAWLTRATATLKTAQMRDARLEAAFVLSAVLKQPVPSLLLHRERSIQTSHKRKADAYLRQRAKRVPLAYIEGEQPFLDFQIQVTPAVLIPRPETEALVLLAAQRLPPTALAADIGTGSGCMAIGLARKMPGIKIYGIDLSHRALAVARRNARRLGVSSRGQWLKGNLATPLIEKGLRLDGFVANLPYVSTAEMKRLQPELKHEPRSAFAGGSDGLRLVRELLTQAPRVLKENGWIGLEVGHRQAQSVAAMMRRTGWTDIQIHKDFSGIERLVEGRRGGE